MTAPAERVRLLLRLAADPGAAPEEARTAAYTAAKMISQHRIPVGIAAAPEPPQYRSPPPPAAEAKPKRRPIASKFAGFCACCGGPYRIGERVLWARGEGAIHLGCREAA